MKSRGRRTVGSCRAAMFRRCNYQNTPCLNINLAGGGSRRTGWRTDSYRNGTAKAVSVKLNQRAFGKMWWQPMFEVRITTGERLFTCALYIDSLCVNCACTRLAIWISTRGSTSYISFAIIRSKDNLTKHVGSRDTLLPLQRARY